jgi:cytochrome P450
MSIIPEPDNQTSLKALQALIKNRSLLSALEVFHAELGNIFGIPLSGFEPIMLVGPEANRFMLVNARHDLRWRSPDDPVTRLLNRGVLVEDGDAHDEIRKTMTPAFHRAKIEHYTEIMNQTSQEVTNTWHIGDKPIDMLVEMRRLSLLILMRTLFTVNFEQDLQRLWKPILKTLDYISPGAWLIWKNVPRVGYQKHLQAFDDYLYEIIQQRRQDPQTYNDMLAMLIDSGMSDSLIRDQLITMIIAGHDTSTAALSWALYLIATHPDVQNKIQQEIDEVLGDKPVEYGQVNQLTYLNQVMNEVLRLYPPIHLGSRISARDLEFEDKIIPAGKRVIYSIYLTHRDPKYWENPSQFIPERFAEDRPRPEPYTYLPFGGGSRNCIGMAFSQVEIKVVLSNILQKFDLQSTGTPVGVKMSATLEPKRGVPIILKPRT